LVFVSRTGISVENYYFNGTLKTTADAGHVTGTNDLTSISNVYMVDVVLQGVASYTKQTVAADFVIDTMVTTISQT